MTKKNTKFRSESNCNLNTPFFLLCSFLLSKLLLETVFVCLYLVVLCVKNSYSDWTKPLYQFDYIDTVS